MKPKGGECRNKLRKHLAFLYFKIAAFIHHFFGACFDFAPLWDGMKPSGASPNRRKDAAATKLALCYFKPRAGAHTALAFRVKRTPHKAQL
ncbi:MAG: hypothetical protein HDT46_08010 [Ruminococcaceae bacterium]|nr:hypothetical protein [Oscillospiraceae bacterium]